MGFYSFIKDDRFIAVSLGLSTIGFFFGMRTILEYYRDEAEIKPTPPKTQYITQETEDSLKQGTLESLLNHYNFAIRDTALKIIAGRATNDGSAIYQLLWGITREDCEERMEALRALAFAMEDKDAFQEPLAALNTPKAYSALVRSLELGLGNAEHEKLDDPLYDEYYLRDIGERRCLMLVSQLVHRYGVHRLVEAGFVERWLAKQPWGDNVEERQKNFAMYSERRKNRISDICFHLTTAQVGRKALFKAKLINRKRRRRGDRSDIKVVLEICINEDERERAELVPRVNEQSAEEQRLRRRHREAMVLNDGTHSLGRSDIIEREHDSNS
ncbi:uncharacterized protein GGS22DRAFT_149617 [Annulohypoxylon maeteangense]|uniref:uncharacterized protein n=1 Tax=Annulohypoxylon maeteangense TaxID=1927788 RepID=UPI0020077EB7|nr:uncharacterized protein GGS22DRAFT_149617 [Annulohypoxylon maeteangense]KAI0889956.1 hypothetical protein GGS22DRAFT_149617 [Annulohypoxylon maeteangense]